MAVIGAGAIGGLVAARLAAAPSLDVTVCVRRGFPTLYLHEGEVCVATHATVQTSPVRCDPADWVLIATKAHQVPDTAPWIARLCRPGTRIVILQNGIEHARYLDRLSPDLPTLPVIVSYSAEATALGNIVLHAAGEFVVPMSEIGAEFATLLGLGGLAVRQVSDFATSAWTKLAYNVTANPITAILGVRLNLLAERAALRRLVHNLVTELIAVGQTHGVTLPAPLAETILADFAGYPDGVFSSMYYDRKRGQQLESDALNGVVVRLGREHCIPTPYNEAIVMLLEGISVP